MGLKTTVEEITPEKAGEYLRTNTQNYRKLSRATVRAYADDMRNGKWELNGEPICFSETGILKDGQHRLAAIILSGKTVRMNVTRGVAEEVTVYNVGKKRVNTDIVRARGVDCSPTIAAVANIIVNRFTGSKNSAKVVDYICTHIDELNRAKRIACYGTQGKAKNAPSIAAAYIMLRTKSLPCYEVELFFRLMNDFSYTFADGYEISPAIVAQRMFDERGSKNSGYQIQKERLEILILAMQDFHAGKKRENKYKIKEPFAFTALLNKVRREDGLEG